MADAVTTQILYDDGGHAVLHLTNVSDGTGESAAIKVDASALRGGGTTTRYAVERIKWATVGMGFNLLFDATADVLFWTCGNATSQGDIDYTQGGTGPGGPGLTNNAGAGVTGDILLTTAGHNAGDSYVVTLWLRKTAA
jgi:hypothetical protein